MAGWCGHCTDLAPDLAKLQDDLGEESFVVVSVSLDRIEGWARNSESKTQQLMEEIKPSHPVLWGDSEVIEAYGEISAVPFVVLIDQEGKLVRDYSNSTKITLKSDIRDLIDG
ncbi:MAG: TlpA disulfide reductase family protein [Verrucomicrobiota bacterium]